MWENLRINRRFFGGLETPNWGLTPNAIYFYTKMGISRNALASGSRQKRQPGANARRLMVQSRWHWANARRLIQSTERKRTGGRSRMANLSEPPQVAFWEFA